MKEKKHKAGSPGLVLFIGALFVPLIMMLAGIRVNTVESENRKPEDFPKMKFTGISYFPNFLKNYTRRVGTYFDDHFPARGPFLLLNREIRLQFLKTDPFPEKVVTGLDGWLFLGESHSDAISESKGLKRFSQKELTDIVNNFAVANKSVLWKHFRFYLVIPPEKSTAYGSFLPIVPQKGPTKLDQVTDELRKIGIQVIDLRDLFTADKDTLLYYKTDSHWNELGLFKGLQRITDKVRQDFPAVPALSFSDFTVNVSETYTGDLANILMLKTKEREYQLGRNGPVSYQELPDKFDVPASYPWNPVTYERRFGSNPNSLKAVIFHDSYFKHAPKMLAPLFGETVFVWSLWNKQIVKAEKPDVVIYELVERDIDLLARSFKQH